MTFSSIVLAVSLPVFSFATNSIAERIAGADPAVCSLPRFADYPNCFRQLRGDSALFTPHSALNKKFWLRDVDFSCVSPWNDSCGSQRAGTLISKRHIIFAKHFPLWSGVRILFVDQEGMVCPCRIQATKALPSGDIMIGLLDYEVTPNIHPAKILPEDYQKHIGVGLGLPIVTFNQREQAILSQLNELSTNEVKNAASTNCPWMSFGRRVISGDSGNPAFLLIGNEPILLYCLKGGGLGSGPPLHTYRREIQAAMDELCPGYKLEAFDFSTVHPPSPPPR